MRTGEGMFSHLKIVPFPGKFAYLVLLLWKWHRMCVRRFTFYHSLQNNKCVRRSGSKFRHVENTSERLKIFRPWKGRHLQAEKRPRKS